MNSWIIINKVLWVWLNSQFPLSKCSVCVCKRRLKQTHMVYKYRPLERKTEISVPGSKRRAGNIRRAWFEWKSGGSREWHQRQSYQASHSMYSKWPGSDWRHRLYQLYIKLKSFWMDACYPDTFRISTFCYKASSGTGVSPLQTPFRN